MNWTIYHAHTNFCDGKNTVEEMVQEAIAKKFYAIGFSGHSPVPFHSAWNMKQENVANYVRDVRAAQEKFADKIKVFLGLEVDFIQGVTGVSRFAELNLDYSIGGVHYAPKNLKNKNEGYWELDFSAKVLREGIEKTYDGNVRACVEDYYNQIIEMVRTDKPDVIAHLDLIKKFNDKDPLFSEDAVWYKDSINGVLAEIKAANCIVEVNTRGVYKKLNVDFYPSFAVLKKCKEYDIPVMLNADAHAVKELENEYSEAIELIKKVGYSELMIFDNEWRAVEISDEGIKLIE